MPTHTVTDAAAIVGSSPSQIRNWRGQFSAHLSPTANPAPGQPRQLTPADVAMLQRVKELRSAGVAYDDIPAQLPAADELPAPYIDVAQVATAPNALESTIEAQQVVTYVENRFSAIQADLLRLQQAQAASAQKQVGQITTFAAGLIVGMVLILVIVGLFALASYVGG